MTPALVRASILGVAIALGHSSLAAGAADPALAAERVIQRTNALRAAQDLAPLRRNGALKEAARRFARYMAATGHYGHTADGRPPTERAAAQGYDYCMLAENIGYQYRSSGFHSAAALAEALVEGWERSPEHRKNLLEPAVTETGVGVARSEDGRYFAVQMFGRPEDAAVRFDVYNRARTGIEYEAGGRAFRLSPHEVRTHRICGPAKLTISCPARPEPFVADAEDGARYTVLDDRIATGSAASGPR